ncbi:MAG: Amuc_1100 family pilus-like protein [Kiritimatiellae bacterium]|nr:Amuc_1100 family pilus-like protein [Kiritimatiellia bacterium]
MKSHKPMLIAGGAVVLVLLLVVGIFLAREVRRFRDAKQDLAGAQRRLDQYYNSNPFPSETNVEQLSKNRESAQRFFSALLDRMSEAQIEPREKMRQTEFQKLFEKTRKTLVEGAAGHEVALKDEFAFGFDRYVRDLPHRAEDVPRLAQQLEVVEQLCGVLYAARVRELLSVGREVFETLPDTASERGRGGAPSEDTEADEAARRRAGIMEPDALYARWHFTLRFRATEGSFLDALNRLAQSRMFVVVTGLAVTNEKAELEPVIRSEAASRGGLTGGADSGRRGSRRRRAGPRVDFRDVPHLHRVAFGNELVDVTLGVDVYRFAKKRRNETAAARRAES